MTTTTEEKKPRFMLEFDGHTRRCTLATLKEKGRPIAFIWKNSSLPNVIQLIEAEAQEICDSWDDKSFWKNRARA